MDIKKYFSSERLKQIIKDNKNVLIAFLVLFFLAQMIRTEIVLGNVGSLQKRDSSLITEVGQIKDSYLKLGDNLNEVRNFLRMPTEIYNGFEEPVVNENADAGQDIVEIALFKYVDSIATTKRESERLEKNSSLMRGLASSAPISTLLLEETLKSSGLIESPETMTFTLSLSDGQELLSYKLSKDTGKLFAQTQVSNDEVFVASIEELEKSVIEFVHANKTKLLDTFVTELAYDVLKKKK